jgi:hypothetical protein
MRWLFLIIVLLMLNAWGGLSFLSSAAVVIWFWYVIELFEKSNDRIAFKEYILVLYGLNYLFSPAVSYLTDNVSFYKMKLPEVEYFFLAIPCIFLLHLGMNCIKTSIFQFSFRTVQIQSQLNQNLLLQWLYAGTVMVFINRFLPADLGFFFYLLSGIRFVAAYGLFIMNASKYKWHLLGITVIELFMSLQQGMFHDFIMWVVFFGILWVYLKKPSKNLKLLMGVSALICLYVLQIAKADYRSQIGQNRDEAGLNSFQEAVEKNVNAAEGVFHSSKVTGSLTRVNQAWIFASAANRMNHFQDYQGIELVSKYAEAAFLPRFIAPGKMKAGDKEIFNKFAGHRVNSGTSMGLGFFADGYIAYGQVGSYFFAFLLGLIFAIIFKIVEHWSKISPFFILLMFPILNYAVRPDCETQTVMGHIVKGIFVFGCLMWYTSIYFSKKIDEIKKDQVLTKTWKSRVAAARQPKTT